MALVAIIEEVEKEAWKVLIVDDDDNNRGVLCDALGGEEYRLLEAVDGQQALAAQTALA